jgi:hypothetical protein
MTGKTLTIRIEQDDRKILLDSKYLLCLAMGIENQPYDIVWRAFDKYLESNLFSWTPEYQLLLTSSFANGETPRSVTESGAIESGQQMTLDSRGIFGPPASGNYPDTLAVVNEYGDAYLGFSQMSTGIDNEDAVTPVYVGRDENVSGVIQLKPVDILLVWFETGVQTSTMFSVPPMVQSTDTNTTGQDSAMATARSFAIEIDMTGSETAAIKYEKGAWSTLS